MRAPNPFSISNYRGVMININMSTGAIISYLIVGTIAGVKIKEVRTLCATPGNNFAFSTLDSIGEMSTGMTLNYKDQNIYNFSYGTPSYSIDGNMGFSGMRADANFLYTRSGSTLHQRNFGGGVLGSVAIPGGSHSTSFDGISPNNSGLDVDALGNIYVGSSTGVHKFNSALGLVSSAGTPNVVYDVAINPASNEVVACGNGFVASVGITTGARVSIPCVVLPVQLLNLNAQCLPSGHVNIQWSVEDQNEVKQFVLERGSVPTGSVEIAWEVISTFKNIENTTIKQYEYIDSTIKKGTEYYYRLKYITKNGQHQYFAPIQVQCFDINEKAFVYPTISQGSFTVQYSSAYSKYSTIEVFNMNGEKLYSKVPQNIIQDNVVETLNLGHLSQGAYLIVVRTKEKVSTQKILIQ